MSVRACSRGEPDGGTGNPEQTSQLCGAATTEEIRNDKGEHRADDGAGLEHTGDVILDRRVLLKVEGRLEALLVEDTTDDTLVKTTGDTECTDSPSGPPEVDP